MVHHDARLFARPSLRLGAFMVVVAASATAAITACRGTVYHAAAECSSEPCDPLNGRIADAAACPSPTAPDGGFHPYQLFANGGASGASASAVFCSAGITLSAYSYNGSPSSPLVLALDASESFSIADLRLPSGAVAGALSGSIVLRSPNPGVYTSADSNACGALSFSYGMLPAPDLDCHADAGSPYSCPKGCTSSYICRDAAAAPCCVPLATTFIYQAAGVADCNGVAYQPLRTNIGSWTLTLTSVTPFTGDSGQPYETFYVAHGTLTASLQGTVDTTDTADLSLTF